MMWSRSYGRLDRVLAAIEIPALGLWLGALIGFAFIFAPAAFRIVTDVERFATLTATVLATLSIVGYVCGGIAIVVALLRSRDAGDRVPDVIRAALVVIALGLVFYQSHAIVPEMAAMRDPHSDSYHALHNRSTLIYGGVLVLGLAALIAAAVRRPD